jgi:hypothetical protein
MLQADMLNDVLASLTHISDADLVARVRSLVARERGATAHLVAHLAELDTRDVYLREGYGSLFVYCTNALGLSEGETGNRIEAARAARRFPEILERLAEGAITLTTVRLLAPHLTLEKLRLAKDMLSHAVPSGDDAAILDRALDALLVDLARKRFANTARPRLSRERPADPSDIPARVKRIVWVRDRGRCAFVGADGHRCGERRFVEFHHLDPRALGGEATPDKISLRCRQHNDYEGRLYFGKQRHGHGRPLPGRPQHVPEHVGGLARDRINTQPRPPDARGRSASPTQATRQT